jgi:hypothetical protein
MFTTLLLTTGLAAGQPPAPVYPQPQPHAIYYGQPVPGAPGAAPTTLLRTGQPTPMGATDPQAAEEVKTEKEEPPAPTKYLLEKSLAETRLGQLWSNRGITVYGWTEMSYNVSTASRSNAPVFMIDRANEFLLNQNYLVAEKTLDTSKKEFQWGWRTDWILPGSDARTTIVRGLWFDQVTNGTRYPIDLFQVYGQVYLPSLGGEGTTVKVGRFATHCEYELVQAVDTPFVSRSYLFQYNPFTHTGVWAVTQLNDTWSVGNGFVTGSDTFFDAPTNRLTYLGQLKWAPKDGKTQALFNVVVTNPKYATAPAFNFYNVYNMQVIHKFNDKLTYVFDGAYSHEDNTPVGSTNWYGAANYLFYAHTDKVTSILRAEVFEDTDGFRTGFRGLYTEVTYGITYKPRDSVLIRPSVRYDNNNQSAPFEGSQNLVTGAIDLIFRW